MTGAELEFAAVCCFLLLIRWTAVCAVLIRWKSLFSSSAAGCFCCAMALAQLETALAASVLNSSSFQFQSLIAAACIEGLKAFLIAAPAAFVLELLPVTGRFSDLLRGCQYAEQIVPGIEERSSPLEQLGSLIAVYAFCKSGALHHIAGELSASSLGSVSPAVSAVQILPLIGVLSSVFAHGVIAAAPLLFVSAVMDIISGCVARALPGMQVTAEVFPLKLAAGMALAAPVFLTAIELSSRLFGVICRFAGP